MPDNRCKKIERDALSHEEGPAVAFDHEDGILAVDVAVPVVKALMNFREGSTERKTSRATAIPATIIEWRATMDGASRDADREKSAMVVTSPNARSSCKRAVGRRVECHWMDGAFMPIGAEGSSRSCCSLLARMACIVRESSQAILMFGESRPGAPSR